MSRLILAVLIACSLFAAEQKLGSPLTLKQPVPVSDVIANPDAYTGKTVQVKGKVTEVCQMMGCWMMIADPATNKALRIQVKDGEIVFPKDSVGKTVIAEGKLVKITMTKEQAAEQARHEAEEQGRKFDPESVPGPRVTYQIQGTGAILLD
jgi:hypothetical protein